MVVLVLRRLCPSLHRFTMYICVCLFNSCFPLRSFFSFFFLLTIVLMVGMVAVFPDIRLVSWPFSWREKPSRFAPHVHIHAERNAD